MRSRLVACAGALGALVLAAAVPGAGAKGGTAITSCGQVVTTNAFLAQDLSCPGGSGVVVGAANITIDLQGHALTGDRTNGTVGVDDTGGFDGVKVENGVVRAFDDGVALDGDDAVVSNLVAAGNEFDGIFINGASARVSASTAAGNNDAGIAIFGNSARVASSSASGNATWGVTISGDSARVASSTVAGNGGGILIVGASARVTSSTVTGNSGIGIRIGGDAARVSGNRADGNGFGFWPNPGGFGIRVSGFVPPVGKNLARGNEDAGECSPSSLC